MNSAARLEVRRKDIDDAIIVHAGRLMPLKVREERYSQFSTLLAGEKLFELGFGEDCYA